VADLECDAHFRLCVMSRPDRTLFLSSIQLLVCPLVYSERAYDWMDIPFVICVWFWIAQDDLLVHRQIFCPGFMRVRVLLNLSGPNLPSVEVSMYFLVYRILVALLSFSSLPWERRNISKGRMFATFHALSRDSIFCVCIQDDF